MIARSLLVALVAALAVGCGDPKPAPENDAPRVVLSGPGNTALPFEIVGTRIDLSVNVSGCVTGIGRVWVTEHDEVLLEKAEGSTTNNFTLQANELPYSRLGIPAGLNFVGHAACKGHPDAGVPKEAKSDIAPVQFMPAQEVLPGPWPMGNNFWVDQDAKTILSCDAEMRRLSKDKKVLGSFRLPSPCSGEASLLFGSAGLRYLLLSGAGFVGFTSTFTTLPSFEQTEFAASALLSPSGKLIGLGPSGISFQLVGFDPQTGRAELEGASLGGTLAGRPTVNSHGELVVPKTLGSSGNSVELGIERFSLDTLEKTGELVIGNVPVAALSTPVLPTLTFDQTADVAYLAEPVDPSRVWACDAWGDLKCTDLGGGRRWTSPSLPGGVTVATRTKNALVAWGERVAYFLDPSTGKPITDLSTGGHIPRSNIVFTYVWGAPNGATYILGQARDGLGNLSAIKQILIFYQPDRLVSDFVTVTPGFLMDVDVNGRAWLWKKGLDGDLTPLMMPSDYRAAVGN